MSLSVERLTELLKSHGIDVKKYGTNSAKTISQLCEEIKSGESSLLLTNDGEAVRYIKIVVIFLRSGDNILIETEQRFHSTPLRSEWTRCRYCGIAEKCLPGEDINVSIHRSLNEELGITYNGEGIVNTKRSTESRQSMSYPGLVTIYDTTNVFIDVKGANINIRDGYKHTEYFDTGLPRLTTTWHWLGLDKIKTLNKELFSTLNSSSQTTS